jgi:hypothetical protein
MYISRFPSTSALNRNSFQKIEFSYSISGRTSQPDPLPPEPLHVVLDPPVSDWASSSPNPPSALLLDRAYRWLQPQDSLSSSRQRPATPSHLVTPLCYSLSSAFEAMLASYACPCTAAAVRPAAPCLPVGSHYGPVLAPTWTRCNWTSPSRPVRSPTRHNPASPLLSVPIFSSL